MLTKPERMVVLLLTLLLVGSIIGLSASPLRLAQATGEPAPGTVIGHAVYTLYPATALTGSGTVQSASPRTVDSRDLSDLRYWNQADVFVNVDFATTGTLTATVQYSSDRANWADAEYTYTNGATLITAKRQVVITGDGTKFISLPVAGRYARVSLQRTASVTPTVDFVLRNNGGS